METEGRLPVYLGSRGPGPSAGQRPAGVTGRGPPSRPGAASLPPGRKAGWMEGRTASPPPPGPARPPTTRPPGPGRPAHPPPGPGPGGPAPPPRSLSGSPWPEAMPAGPEAASESRVRRRREVGHAGPLAGAAVLGRATAQPQPLPPPAALPPAPPVRAPPARAPLSPRLPGCEGGGGRAGPGAPAHARCRRAGQVGPRWVPGGSGGGGEGLCAPLSRGSFERGSLSPPPAILSPALQGWEWTIGHPAAGPWGGHGWESSGPGRRWAPFPPCTAPRPGAGGAAGLAPAQRSSGKGRAGMGM